MQSIPISIFGFIRDLYLTNVFLFRQTVLCELAKICWKLYMHYRKLRKLCFCIRSKERSDVENGVYVFLFIPNFVPQKVERRSLKTEKRTRKQDREYLSPSSHANFNFNPFMSLWTRNSRVTHAWLAWWKLVSLSNTKFCISIRNFISFSMWTKIEKLWWS